MWMYEDFTLTIEESNGDITFKGKVVDAFQKSKPILKKAAKWAVGVGLAVGTTLVAIALAKSEKDNENSDGSSDNDNSAYTPLKKLYQGYIPSGCSFCGGPYPLCKGGCPIFDDD